MHPDKFLALLEKTRASAILRTPHGEAAEPAMEAAVRGGFRVIEFTMSVPGVLDLVRKFSKKQGLVVGVGTVLTIDEAREAVKAGAGYLVSPVVDEAVIQEALSLGVTAMPGSCTPTEMMRAHRAGAQLQKLFPEVGTGPAWVKQTLGPLPFLRIVPTSGVTLENAADYFKAGAFAVGFVNSLFEPADVGQGRFDLIEARARKMIEAVSNVR